MATYAIGDIQGCYQQFLKLLNKIRFDPTSDRLLLTGDLVNRGPQSLAVLRYAIQYETSVDIVLGNHELHLLAVLDGTKPMRDVDTFHDIVRAPEREQIRQWLGSRPMAIHDPTLNILMTHAGVHPDWTLDDCLRHAQQIESILRSPERPAMLRHMFGNKPRRWSESYTGWRRTRFIINALTRMRYLTTTGKMDFTEVCAPGRQPTDLVPWFDLPTRRTINTTIVFGHWASLGVYHQPGLLALDSGCCWGRRLSAARLDCHPIEILSVRCKKSKDQPDHNPPPLNTG